MSTKTMTTPSSISGHSTAASASSRASPSARNIPRAPFATFLILCPTSFFLGILFTNLPFDYPTLWTSAAPSESVLASIESHYRLLSLSPPLIPRVLHSTILVALAGFAWKLLTSSASESNYLFDGASLVLFLIGFIMYATNVLQGLKIVELGLYGEMGRVESLKVMAASQTILALVLIGVLVLQAGQWYAEGKEAEEREKSKAEREKEKEKDGGANQKRKTT